MNKHINNKKNGCFMKKAFFIVNHKNKNDSAVTNLYLKIIYKALLNRGYSCIYDLKNNKIDKKKDLLVFDECKIAFSYLIKGYRNVIIWTQGIVPEEAILQGYPRYRYYLHSLFEYTVLKKAKLIFMVSNEMLAHYQKKYKLSLKARTFIMPCFNETKIDEQSFNNQNKYVDNTFVYLGSLSKWQCFEETVDVYKQIEEKTKTSKLYVYTENVKLAKNILQTKHVRNYNVDFVESTELGSKIRDYKYGFVLRENIEVNRVATPTKLSNYISHGIIPVYSTCLKSFDNYNRKEKMAIDFDLNSQEKGIQEILENMKKNVSIAQVKDWAETTFDSYYNAQRYVSKIIEKMKLNKI